MEEMCEEENIEPYMENIQPDMENAPPELVNSHPRGESYSQTPVLQNLTRAEKRVASILASFPTKCRRFERLANEKQPIGSVEHALENKLSQESPMQQQVNSPGICEEEITQVLENMGTLFFSEGIENFFENPS